MKFKVTIDEVADKGSYMNGLYIVDYNYAGDYDNNIWVINTFFIFDEEDEDPDDTYFKLY